MSLDCLRRVALALAAGRMPAAVDAQEHGHGLLCYLERTCPSLEHALDLPAAGHPQRDRLAERDKLVAGAIARHFEGRAVDFAGELASYREAGWKLDRVRDNPPPDEMQAVLWRVLRCRDTVIGRRRAEQIFAKYRP